MINLKSFENFEDENIYSHINVQNKINESSKFGDDIFKKILNFSGQRVLIIGCSDFAREINVKSQNL